MENPIKIDDLGVPPFKETPICSFPIRSSFLQGCRSLGLWPSRNAKMFESQIGVKSAAATVSKIYPNMFFFVDKSVTLEM